VTRLEYKNNWRKSWRIRNPKREMLQRARDHAKRRDVPFNLELEDLVIPVVCPALGIPLMKAVGGHQSDNSPSVDRFEPLKGYTKGNISVISSKANRIKSNATAEELRKVADWMVNRGRQEN